MLIGKEFPTKIRALQQYIYSLLQNCNNITTLTQIHSQIITNNLSHKSFILSKLLSLYISNDYPHYAFSVFKNIPNPSTKVWNHIIRSYSRSEKGYESFFILFKQMVGSENKPDGYTYSYVISGCARFGLKREGEMVHGRVISNGYCSDLFVCTNLVNLYMLNGEGIRDACKVFNRMSERNVVTWNTLLVGYINRKDIDMAFRVFESIPEKSVVSWTTMISGCAENGRCKQAISLFYEMRKENVELDQVAMVAVLSACAELGDIELGMWIHSYVLENFSFRNQKVKISLSNAIIHMYASCGMIDEAYKVFLGMTKRSVVSWTSMIAGYAKQGLGEEALCTFYWMLCEPEAKPDEITLLAVLSACSHSGLVNEGRQIFKTMYQNWGIKPKIEHYGCYVDLLSRAGFLEEAYRVVEAMDMKPNDAIWGAILGGCTIHKNVELGSCVAKKLMVGLDPDQASRYLVLVSNMYASGMRWKDVAEIREKVLEMGMKKPPGKSCIQIEGVVHDFFACDMNHEHGVLIYKVLGEIYTHANSEEKELDLIYDNQRLWD